MTSYLCGQLSSQVPRTHRSVAIQSVVACNPNVKATVSEAVIHFYYWFGYGVGVHWNHQAGFGSKRINIISQCSSKA